MALETNRFRKLEGVLSSPQAHSNTRLALVACTILATVGMLLLVTLEARRVEQELASATRLTLRDYTGYAGRLMGAEVLRRFSDERADILAPVTGSAGRTVPAPALQEIVDRGARSFSELGVTSDAGLGYFRIDLLSGAVEGRGAVHGAFATLVADTLRALLRTTPHAKLGRPDIRIVSMNGEWYSVAFTHLVSPAGVPTAIYGFTYTRKRVVAAFAAQVFRETPLLPTSFTGTRWNYDTTLVNPGEVVNDSLLGMRITDRAGHVFWQSGNTAAITSAQYWQRAVLSTAAGGLNVEAVILPAREPVLIPSTVRRAQRWSLRALLALTLLLAIVSLIALRGEQVGVRARRAEAMQQLALGLRHELNNALASVMLNAELLREEDTLDPSQQERLQSIVEQADRMRNVLRKLEKSERLEVMVPYLTEGLMVDLSAGEEVAIEPKGAATFRP
jgi:hypothetical protein